MQTSTPQKIRQGFVGSERAAALQAVVSQSGRAQRKAKHIIATQTDEIIPQTGG